MPADAVEGHIDIQALDLSDATLRAKLALEAGRMGSWTWDVAQDAILGDELTAHLLGLDFDKQPWRRSDILRHLHPDDIAGVQDAMDAAMAGEDVYEVEIRRFITDDQSGARIERWVQNRGRVSLRSEDGRASKFVGVLWDITDIKLHDQAVRMIAGDMDHRAKNAFAVIRAMINLGKRTSQNVESFADTLRGQVEAMAGAHTLAAKVSRSTQTPHAPVPIIELIEDSLKPWSVGLDTPDRMSIIGDAELTVAAETAASLSMMLHQLAASSAKHGAIGPLGGAANVTVTCPTDDAYDLVWNERFETPLADGSLDRPDDGFGAILLSHCVATLQGEATREFRVDGLQFSVRMPR